jgi:hypothetical protein
MLNLRKGVVPAVLLLGLMLASCLSGRVKEGYDKSISDLKSRLKDPSSLQLGDCYYVTSKSESGDDDYLYKIPYNAKNSYGTYTGFSTVYYQYDHGDTGVTFWGSGDTAGSELYAVCKIGSGETKI